MTDTDQDDDPNAPSAPPIPLAPLRQARGLQAISPNMVDGTGLPKFAIDSRTIHEQHLYKGYVVSLGWVLCPDTGRADAAVTIFPERRFDDAGAWVVTRRGVMKLCDENNRPTKLCLEQAAEALPVLGYGVNRIEIIRLVDVLMAFVDDLIQMPVPSLSVKLILQGDPMWDVTVHAQDAPNKVLREATI